MNNVWVLSVKTSLPAVCENAKDMKTEFRAFKNFEDAKQLLQKKLKELAFTENSMFDGNGGIVQFERYIESSWDLDEDEEVYEDTLTKSGLLKITDAIKNIFKGECFDVSVFAPYASDSFIAVEVEDGVMTFYGEDDGPFNGYDPVFASNMFDMSEEKDYFLYIDDLFGQDGSTSELYIDLKKVEVE